LWFETSPGEKESKTPSEGRNPNSQKTHEKMLTIPGHKGNVNQNHTDSTSPLLE
jgi:hypothetical protein